MSNENEKWKHPNPPHEDYSSEKEREQHKNRNKQRRRLASQRILITACIRAGLLENGRDLRPFDDVLEKIEKGELEVFIRKSEV